MTTLAETLKRNRKPLRATFVVVSTLGFLALIFVATPPAAAGPRMYVSLSAAVPGSAYSNYTRSFVDNGGSVYWENIDLVSHTPFKSGCFQGPKLAPGGEWIMTVSYDAEQEVLRLDGKTCSRRAYQAPDGNGDVVFAYSCKDHPEIFGVIRVNMKDAV